MNLCEFVRRVPWRALISNSAMQYLSSGVFVVPCVRLAVTVVTRTVSSVKFLQLVSVLTFTITNGMKRAFIVAVAMLYFAMPMTWMNTSGVVLAMGGGIL